MRWMIRGCEFFFLLLFNFAQGEEGGRERWMYYSPCFLSGRIQTNFCRSFSCTSSQSIERVNGQ